jgi:hypothetical protein
VYTNAGCPLRPARRTYTPEHLARVRDVAARLGMRCRRWCPNGALPILCVVRARGLERVEAGVVVVSLDRLLPALRTAARTKGRPAFLAPRPADVRLGHGAAADRRRAAR